MPEAISFDEELKGLATQKPFQPFTIKLTNGERFDVTYATQIAIASEGNAGVFLNPKRGIVHFRKNQIVSVHVTEAEEA
jgi:hypothetical protein